MAKIINNLFCILSTSVLLIILESLFFKEMPFNFIYKVIKCPDNVDKFNFNFNFSFLLFCFFSLFFKKANIKNSFLNLLILKAVVGTMKTINTVVLNYSNIIFVLISLNFLFSALQIRRLKKMSEFLIFYAISRLIFLKYQNKIEFGWIYNSIGSYIMSKINP